MTALAKPSPQATVLSLAQLLEQQPPSAPPCLVEPGLLPPQGILFVGGEPKVGKSLLVANLALARYEIGSAFRSSSALHAEGDSYMLLTRRSPQLPTIELRFQYRYAAAQSPRLRQLDPHTLWFSSAGQSSVTPRAARRKVEQADVTQALAGIGEQVRYTQ